MYVVPPPQTAAGLGATDGEPPPMVYQTWKGSNGIYGYPIDMQTLFLFALRSAKQMLKPEYGGDEELFKRTSSSTSS